MILFRLFFNFPSKARCCWIFGIYWMLLFKFYRYYCSSGRVHYGGRWELQWFVALFSHVFVLQSFMHFQIPLFPCLWFDHLSEPSHPHYSSHNVCGYVCASSLLVTQRMWLCMCVIITRHTTYVVICFIITRHTTYVVICFSILKQEPAIVVETNGDSIKRS